MLPLKSIITPEELDKLASRSNYRYGKALAEDASIRVSKSNTFNLHAELQQGKGRAYQVELMSTTKGFRWKCSCTNKKDYFCEHCVAVALSAQPPKLVQE
jgi:uncharacterized Zn finger protein